MWDMIISKGKPLNQSYGAGWRYDGSMLSEARKHEQLFITKAYSIPSCSTSC